MLAPMQTSTFLFNKRSILLGCIFLIICNVLYAQKDELNTVATKKEWSINLNAGSTQYWGYINSMNIGSSLKHNPTGAYGFVLSREISPLFGIRGQFLMGKMKGRKDVYSDGTPANLQYFSDFVEINITTKISFTDLIKGYQPNRILNIYGLAGIGLSNSQGNTTNNITWNAVKTWGNKKGRGINGYEIEPLGTVGVGLSVKLTKELNITFENAMKFVHTNKLFERNGSIHYDLYGYSSIGLTYNFSFKKAVIIAPVAKTIIKEEPKPIIAEKKPIEVKKEVVSAHVPVNTEPKVTPLLIVKQPVVKPVPKVVLFSGYKIQILASTTPIPFDDIMKKYNLLEQIREDHFNKWYRYSVGEYSTYNEANAYSKILKKRNKLTGTFIVKIEDGKRIGPVGK